MSIKNMVICNQCGSELGDESAFHGIEARLDGDRVLLERFIFRWESLHFCNDRCFEESNKRLKGKNSDKVWLTKRNFHKTCLI